MTRTNSLLQERQKERAAASYRETEIGGRRVQCLAAGWLSKNGGYSRCSKGPRSRAWSDGMLLRMSRPPLYRRRGPFQSAVLGYTRPRSLFFSSFIAILLSCTDQSNIPLIFFPISTRNFQFSQKTKKKKAGINILLPHLRNCIF